VTRDQWDDIRQKYLAEGAESVEFINKPENEHRGEKAVYNIYVRTADTDKKIAERAERNKKFRTKKPVVEPDTRPPPEPSPLQTDTSGKIEIQGLNSEGKPEGIYTVEPIGKYAAAISFTPIGGQKQRLTIKKERQNRQIVNMSNAKILVERFKNRGIDAFRYHLERGKPGGNNIEIEIGSGPAIAGEKRKIPWENDLNLSFSNSDEARAWASNNLKTIITGIEPTTELGHAAHMMAWVKRFETEHGIQMPGRIHLGLHANWGRRATGTYYYSSNSMHFQQDRQIPYDIAGKRNQKLYLAQKEQEGYTDTVPWSASTHADAIYWHEFGHLLDHLTRNGLSNAVASLSLDERKQLSQLSDYPKNYHIPAAVQAEYAAEAVSSVMTGERTEHVPEPLKEAINKAFSDMPRLNIDYAIQDPVHERDWTNTEGTFYNAVKLPKKPEEISDDELREYYQGMDPDEVFHVLKHARAALQDPRLDPEKQKKDTTREERYRIRQNLERIIGIISDIRAPELDIQQIRPDDVWMNNADGYEQTPYYGKSDGGYVRDGILELRPSGAAGMALYHIDEDGNAILLVDHRDAYKTNGIVDVERSRQSHRKNIKNQAYKLSSRKIYENERKYYVQREERRKASAKKQPPKKQTGTLEPDATKPMHSDLKKWVKEALYLYGNEVKRPSQMTSEEQDKVVEHAVDSLQFMFIASTEQRMVSAVATLVTALAKKPETRSEKILYKKHKDHLNEAVATQKMHDRIIQGYTEKKKKKFGTDNEYLVRYMNDEMMDSSSGVRPSQWTDEKKEDVKKRINQRLYMTHLNIERNLIERLSDPSLTPKQQRDLTETLNEHRIIVNLGKEIFG
jgi:hypothetical protein